MQFYNTTTPYQVIPYRRIQYGVCRDFSYICRYRGLRQITHSPDDIEDRVITLETPNVFQTNIDVDVYEVPSHEENRLDLIAYKHLGSADYAWVLAYFNGISDGYTVREGQKLNIPKAITQLFNKGEILESIPPLALNLGSE